MYNNKAEHAVQSYATGVGAWGLGTMGYIFYTIRWSYDCWYGSKRWEENNQLKTNLRWLTGGEGEGGEEGDQK